MRFLLGFLLGLLAGVSRQVWWPWALKAIDWLSRELAK
jgi:hypothetical protein